MNFEVKTIENETEEDRMLNELALTPVQEKFIEIGEEKFVLPIYFNQNWHKVNKFEVRDDDVFIIGHMKTGTSWLHEIINSIVYGVNREDSNTPRLPKHLFLEFAMLFNPNVTCLEFPEAVNFIDNMNYIESPRCIRTHLPWMLLPEQIRNGTKSPKIIHVRRNPKDTCISFYHHCRAMNGYRGTFEQFCKLFLAGRLHYGPFFANVKSYWEQRNRPNIFFVNYSDLKTDLSGTITKMAKFLGRSLSEKELEALVEDVSLDSMKKHVGKEMDEFKRIFTKSYKTCIEETAFVREGKEGGYKTVMSKELIEEFDKREREALGGTDLYF